MSVKSLSSHEVTCQLKKATTFGFASLLLWKHRVGGSCSVKGVIRQHTEDCNCGWGSVALLLTFPL